MSFDLDAVREWANWPELPDVRGSVLDRYWRQLVSDVLAACDEIERLQGELELAKMYLEALASADEEAGV
jgi:hypothetical protein